MALAYLLGKPTAKALKVKVSVALLMVVSIIPDIDLLLFPSLHRGPTHSVVTAVLVFIPLFIVYRKQAAPYFVALLSHSLIGDFLVGGQLHMLWPFTNQQFGLHELGSYYIDISSPVNVALELSLFAAATIVMVKNKDILQFFKPTKTNLVLVIPIFTVLLPTFIGYPFTEPLLVSLPAEAAAHLFYIVLFGASVLITLNWLLKRKPPQRLKLAENVVP